MAKEIGIYGKGGIGKSLTVSQISVALSEKGFKVMQVGCDPKADSTNTLLGGRYIPTILDTVLETETVREFREIDVSKVIFEGYNGVICAECGGPEPGIGCAGRGVITAIELMKQQGAFDRIKADYILYDVLGDVVCGGFAMPLRQGIAKQVYIVVSSNFASLYSANNLFRAIVRFAERDGAQLSGLIANYIDTPEQKAVVDDFAAKTNTEVVAYIPYASELALSDFQGKTIFEAKPDSKIADLYRELAARVVDKADKGEVMIPVPVEDALLRQWGEGWLGRLRASSFER